MARIRGLELLFNLAQNQLKSKEDCVVTACHCLLINENLQCVGIGDEWPKDASETSTELLPKEWNRSQEVYSLRYISKDSKKRYLLKIVRAGHTLHVNVAVNEDKFAMMSLSTEDYVTESYADYSNAYKDLERLSNAFKKEIIEKLQSKQIKPKSGSSSTKNPQATPVAPPPAAKPMPEFDSQIREQPFMYPRVGGRDLDPFGRAEGGMLMDPSSFGIPSRPSLPDMGIGGPRGLPRGAVPPGARFDPFGPPIGGPNRFNPDPDHFNPPDFDMFM